MEILKKYPQLSKQFDTMYQTRRNEILAKMLENDDEYKKLCQERTNNSMKLKEAIVGSEIDVLFEKYSNSAYAQDIYELDFLYKQAVKDTIDILEENDII
ncbi:MAG: hypothetical protein LBM93_14020 [Oscillospiraceae bacterium]|jgi:hypothetical protein|nr:hypothetical protein [Oscillospiraceae bacterium]